MADDSAATLAEADDIVPQQPVNMAEVSFTEEEKAIFDRLRARLADMKGDSIADDFLAEDSIMWRYYTAHAEGLCPGPEDKIEEVLDAAESMFRQSVAWRHEAGVNEMWDRWRSDIDVTKREPFVQLGSLVFYGQGHISADARTATGGPLIFERLGKVDVKGIMKDDEVRAAVVEAYTMSLETAWRTARACGGKARATMVVDLKGLGWSFFSNMSFIKSISKIGPPNYPEITERVLIVRAPWIMKAVWKIIGPLLPKRTREKVMLLLFVSSAVCVDTRVSS